MNAGFPHLPKLPEFPHLHFEFPQFLRGLTGILIAIAGLTVIDLFLAGLERAEVGAEAQRHFEAGQRLVAARQYESAAEEFRSAVSIARENRAYRRAWAQALFDGGLLDAAVEQAREALAVDPNGGEANLLLARIQAKQGDTNDALFSYRRAIYGRWPEGQAERRSEARWELTELLSQEGRGDELLGELLLFQSEAPDDLEVRRRVAKFYLTGGFPARATPLYRELVRVNSGDADAYAGLAESQFQTGDLRSAALNFQFAAQLNPEDQQSAERFALIRRIQALDPAARGIGSNERLARAAAILRIALEESKACAARRAGSGFATSWNRLSERAEDRAAMRREESPVDWATMQASQLLADRASACPSEPEPRSVDAQALAYLLRDTAE